MANIKSAKKRVVTSRKNAEHNKAIKTEVKTYIKKVDATVIEGNKAEAEKALVEAESKMTKAASKGIYHKNTVARKIGRLKKAVSKMA